MKSVKGVWHYIEADLYFFKYDIGHWVENEIKKELAELDREAEETDREVEDLKDEIAEIEKRREELDARAERVERRLAAAWSREREAPA